MIFKYYKKEIFVSTLLISIIVLGILNKSEDNIYNFKLGLLASLIYFLLLSSIELS